MKKIMNRKALGIIALALVCVMAGTVLGTAHPSAVAETETVVLTSPFTEAIAKVRDSVVGVYNYQLVSTYPNGYGSYGYGFPFGDIFGDLYGYGYGYGYGNGGNGYGNGGNGNGGNGNGGNGRQQSEVKYASGSGTVIAKEYVLTNYHVIENASSLKISVGGDDSNLYEATVAATDPDKDVAVLHVPGLPVEPVELGDSDKLQVGDWAINIGNAIGFTGTVTAGIISALDREIEGDTTKTDRYGRKSTVVNTMIQTDAAINSGNSGGGMFNTAGQLVGIPTLKYSGTRYSSGAAVESIGMCIPINEAKDVINEALSGKNTQEAAKEDDGTAQDDGAQAVGGRIGKPRLGVTVPSGNQQISNNGVWPNGAYIISVEEGSPAEQAGLKAGDILVEINGEVIASSDELMSALDAYQEGDVLNVKVWRPETVESAEQGRISYAGEYVDNIQVTLKVLDNIAQ